MTLQYAAIQRSIFCSTDNLCTTRKGAYVQIDNPDLGAYASLLFGQRSAFTGDSQTVSPAYRAIPYSSVMA